MCVCVWGGGAGGRHFVSWQSGEREKGGCPSCGMFLTVALLRNKIPGGQWIGKHRRPRFVTVHMKNNMIRRLEIEAENEYWLSQPYMTKEQEFCHNRERRQAYFKALVAAAKSKFPEHKYASEHLDHLNVTKKWTSS